MPCCTLNGEAFVLALGVRITSIVGFLCLSGMVVGAQGVRRPFTVADDIELTHFYDVNEPVRFSPDGNYFVVYAARGRLKLNRVEESLRFYRSQDVQSFLDHSDVVHKPSPVWIENRSGKEGPIIEDWRWLSDSSGVAFLERVANGNRRLVLADLRKTRVEVLASAMPSVRGFDVFDRQHYVYTVADPVEVRTISGERELPAIVGTGRDLARLILPDDPLSLELVHRNYLWVVDGGKRFELKSKGVPIVLFDYSARHLALSPDGKSLVTRLPVPKVPETWETLYPPPFTSSVSRIRAGQLDVKTGHGSANQYVRINLATGLIQPLTDAPIGADGGWFAGGRPSWSADGKAILLPDTFLHSDDRLPSRPCVAVVELASSVRTCVEMLKGGTETGVEEGYHAIVDARFVSGDKKRLTIIFRDHQSQTDRATEYRRSPDGTWQVIEQNNRLLEVGPRGLEVTVKQGLNEPPTLLAANQQESRVIWSPNPQLKSIELGQASIYTWRDKEGRDWRGGLYLPANYKTGMHYPLVIQTHGFVDSEFIPSGLFSTAFAARALAAAGIAVLQVGEGNCPKRTFNEGACAVSGYEVAARRLISEGLADPEKIGIIGFSRSCFYVMEMLTTGSLHLKAASITDGVMESYLQYMMWIDPNPEADSMIGAPPFGKGLPRWLARSPGFNFDKVTVPLLVVGEGPVSLLEMWEPYAGLRYLQKPVDLIMLNTDEHLLTNPAVRLASQGGSVDWFRFWLQEFEDPNPAKSEQYRRWRELRKLQRDNQNNLDTP